MEDIYEKIREALRREWQNGATQQEIADRANVTNPYINNLLSGKRKVESMKLETLFKLFPNAEINLSGAQLAGDHAIQIQGGVKSETSAVINKILEDASLTAEEKVAIGKALISENETVDYTNADTFAVSQLTEARQEKWNRFQEIGWTGEQYAKLFEVWQKTKAGTIKALMDTYGYTQSQAETIWRMVKNQ